jgi:Putative Ig domain/Right handed beta helix region
MGIGSMTRATGQIVFALTLLASLLVLGDARARAAVTIQVPEDYATISAAISAASSGDIIDIAPGVYPGGVTLSKSVTLRGRSADPGDPANNTTILEASSSVDVITIPSGVTPAPTITGLYLRNGLSGVSLKSPAVIEGNYFLGNNDQLDYKSGGGGLCRGNVFQDALDDGIDINHPVRDLTIEDNVMASSDGDGVEMRLNDDAIGSTAHIVFRGNRISGSRSDGIQIIDYYTDTNRVISIERNLIHDNGRAGIGLLDDGKTIEDYRAASIRERIAVFHNTLVRNNHGVSGGDNLIALNNVFIGHFLALKNVDGDSVASHNLFWANTTDTSGSVVQASTLADPLLDAGYALQPSSPAIDAGVARFGWNGEVVMDQPSSAYEGTAPDLGWKEASTGSGGGAPPTMTSVTISPSSPGTDALLTANAVASDPDADPVSFSYQWLKSGSSISGATGKTLNLSTPSNGDKGDLISVRVTATDGSTTSSPMTSATVTIVNTDPTFDQDLADRSNAEGGAVSFSAGATDPDGDALTYAAAGLPPGVTIGAGDGSISGTIAPGAADSSPYSVSVTVRDGTTVDATDTFTWVISGSPSTDISFRAAAGVGISARSAITIARPLGVVAGDVEVASILVVGAASVTPPAGWSLVRTDPNGSAFTQRLYVHVAGAAEPTSYRFKLSLKSKAAGTLAAYAGVDAANPIAASSGQANASSTSITASAIASPVAGELVGFFGIVVDVANPIASPIGMTERVEASPLKGKPRPTLELADAALTQSGDTGSRTAIASLAGPSIGQLVVLRPSGT